MPKEAGVGPTKVRTKARAGDEMVEVDLEIVELREKAVLAQIADVGDVPVSVWFPLSAVEHDGERVSGIKKWTLSGNRSARFG